MNIVFIAKNIPVPGYKENDIIIRQIKLLKENGFDVELVIPTEIILSKFKMFGKRLAALSSLESCFIVDNIKVTKFYYIRLPIFGLDWLFSNCFLYFFNFNLIRKLKKDSIAVVHSNFVFPDAIVGNKLCKILKAKHVLSIREGDYLNLNSKINKNIFKNVITNVDKIISMTPSLKRGLMSVSKKTVIIPSFIDDIFFENKDYSLKRRDGILKFITIANMLPRKNIDWIIDYFYKNKSKNIALDIIGDGECFDYLYSLSKLDERIKFHGRLDKKNIIEHLDNSDVFILPSCNESFGLVYAEAAARGNIILGLSNTGLDGFKSEGFFFVNDKNDLFNKIDKISFYSNLKINALKRLNQEKANIFSSERYFTAVSSLYNNLK